MSEVTQAEDTGNGQISVELSGNGQIRVELSSFVRWVANIKEISRTYEMSVDIDVQWKASADDLACSDDVCKTADWQPTIIPELVVQNAYNLSDDSYVICAHGAPFELRRKTGMNFFRKRYTGEFFAPFNLQLFPFDIQQLPLVIEMSFFGTDKVWLVPPSLYDYTVWFNREFSVLSTFMVNGVASEYDNRGGFSRYKMNIYVERNWIVYMYRVILPVLLISGAALLMYSLDATTSVDARLGLGITLLLTMVAFEFTLAQDLPKDPRLSILDKYVKMSFAFQLFVLIAVAAVGWRHGETYFDQILSVDKQLFDWYMFLASAAIWIFMQVYLIFAGVRAFTATGRRACGCFKVLCGCVGLDEHSALMVTQTEHTMNSSSFSAGVQRRLQIKKKKKSKKSKVTAQDPINGPYYHHVNFCR